MMKTQRVQRFNNEKWVDIRFIDVKEGMIIRIFDKSGEIMHNKRGGNEFKATSDVYKNKFGINVFNYIALSKYK